MGGWKPRSRILCLDKVSPLTLGGAEVRLREIQRRLACRDHELDTVCGRSFVEYTDFKPAVLGFVRYPKHSRVI